ncbi:hypothetical protein [Herbaspirillum sp. NPDC087042]|uniref:hypothetical protein n=1 Tax=Herbaspirillum sp. NPDC087042 TaxID=3364004 RepID=UPI00382D7517
MFFDTVSRIDGHPHQHAMSPQLAGAGLAGCLRGLRNFDIVCVLFFIIPYWGAVLGSA